MNTPVGLRPTAWEPRQRIIAAVVALLIVLGATLWWLGGTEGRRAASACDFYDDQQSALHTVTDEATEAADRAEAAKDDAVIGSFNDVDREFNSLRRWQSTYPRLTDALGDVGSDGVDSDAESTFDELTQGVAEMQRLIEGAEPAEVLDWVPELNARLDNADELCSSL